MKICVVTIYRNDNVGSALQAYAMQKVLSDNKATVIFLKNVVPANTFYTCLKRAIKAVLKLRFKEFIGTVQKYKKFSKMQSFFIEVSADKLMNQHIDCFVLGSDVIWDLSRKRPEYFWGIGSGFVERKVISYAASVANTSAELLAQHGFTRGSLDHIKSIAVRDQHTKDVIQPIVNTPVSLVCDPTMLLTATDYEAFKNNSSIESGYVLLYLRKVPSVHMSRELTDMAQQKNLRIISLLDSCRFCADKVVKCDPWSFITYYLNADYIITDTFHGSVFSIIFRKQFVAIQRGMNKVNDLLERLHLSHRLVDDKNNMAFTLEQAIEWIQTEKALSILREQSLSFLFESLKQE
jgi:hypothetical protein